MVQLGIDCRFASLNVGIGRYTRELVCELVRLNTSYDLTLFVRSKDEDWLQGLEGSCTLHPTPYAHYSFQEQIFFPRDIKKSSIDYLFSPHFNVPYFCPVPFTAVVHDLILHHYPNQASLLKRLAYKVLMQRTISKAERVIAVSENTAEDIRSMYPSCASKLKVIGEGVSPLYRKQLDEKVEEVRGQFGIDRPYFLYVGGAKEHKNVQVLLDAHRKLDDDSLLVLVTGGREVENLDMHESVRILQNVSDEELPALYSGAKAFVTASLYEGYCLPVIEALSSGCPVIASNRGSIPEVSKGYATLIEPTVEDFSGAMKSSPTLIGNFESPTWEEAAKEVLDLF